jgi:hypothetical protein
MMLLIFVCIMIPFKIAIKEVDTLIMNRVLNSMDVIFIIDLIMQFFMSVTDKDT